MGTATLIGGERVQPFLDAMASAKRNRETVHLMAIGTSLTNGQGPRRMHRDSWTWKLARTIQRFGGDNDGGTFLKCYQPKIMSGVSLSYGEGWDSVADYYYSGQITALWQGPGHAGTADANVGYATGGPIANQFMRLIGEPAAWDAATAHNATDNGGISRYVLPSPATGKMYSVNPICDVEPEWPTTTNATVIATPLSGGTDTMTLTCKGALPTDGRLYDIPAWYPGLPIMREGFVQPSTPNGKFYQVTAATVTTGATQPTWLAGETPYVAKRSPATLASAYFPVPNGYSSVIKDGVFYVDSSGFYPVEFRLPPGRRFELIGRRSKAPSMTDWLTASIKGQEGVASTVIDMSGSVVAGVATDQWNTSWVVAEFPDMTDRTITLKWGAGECDIEGFLVKPDSEGYGVRWWNLGLSGALLKDYIARGSTAIKQKGILGKDNPLLIPNDEKAVITFEFNANDWMSRAGSPAILLSDVVGYAQTFVTWVQNNFTEGTYCIIPIVLPPMSLALAPSLTESWYQWQMAVAHAITALEPNSAILDMSLVFDGVSGADAAARGLYVPDTIHYSNAGSGIMYAAAMEALGFADSAQLSQSTYDELVSYLDTKFAAVPSVPTALINDAKLARQALCNKRVEPNGSGTAKLYDDLGNEPPIAEWTKLDNGVTVTRTPK